MDVSGLFFIVCTLAVNWGPGDTHPDGAPVGACVQMVPGHISRVDGTPISPQGSASPFSIVAKGSEYSAGGMVNVTIVADPSNTTFQGFLLQARSVGSSDPVGTFLAGSDGASKLITCNARGDSVTHTSDDQKQAGMSFMWQAPTASVGDIKFLLTVAQDHDVYWVRMETNTVTGSASSAALTMPLLLVLLVITFTTSQ